MSEMKLGFEMQKIRLPLDVLLPVRQIKDPEKIVRYGSILKSIPLVGVLEPLSVFPLKGQSGKYLLLDGHLRLIALKALGETEADCIVAKDDESFTYNARVSRLAPIQEHKMIMKAVQNGVPPERIAEALNIPVKNVRSAMTLLDDIHPEAVELLKDKPTTARAIRMLRKVTGVRQVEIAEFMVSANNFTATYAEALVLGTSQDQLANPEQPKKKQGMSAEDIARLEQEMDALQKDMKTVDDTYGKDMLNLTLARGFIKKLLENARVVRFLNLHHPEIGSQFEDIAEAEAV
jgi:ParB-like chromosome segregation protein Spo0J